MGCTDATTDIAAFDGLVLGFTDSGSGPVLSSWAAFLGTGRRLATEIDVGVGTPLDDLRGLATWEELDPVAGTPYRGVGRFEAAGRIDVLDVGDATLPRLILSAGPDCDRLHPPFLEAGPEPVGLTYRAQVEQEGYTAIVRTDRSIPTEYTGRELIGDIQHVVVALDGDSILWSTRAVDVDGEPAREVIGVFHPPSGSGVAPIPDPCGSGFLVSLPDGSTQIVTVDPATGEFLLTQGPC